MYRLQELESIVKDMARESLSNEDVPFILMRFRKIMVRKLKCGKVRARTFPHFNFLTIIFTYPPMGGYDGILAKHLIWGGDVVSTWLLMIVNSIRIHSWLTAPCPAIYTKLVQ